MDNIYSSKEYQESRRKLDVYFIDDNIIKAKTFSFKNYKLIINTYKSEEGCWSLTRGMLYDGEELIADIKRNYHSFPFDFVCHKNGNVYLICGEDYQGYTIVNCTERKTNTFIPSSWIRGCGFCWASINENNNYLDLENEEDDRNNDEITIEGCYWGGPYEIVVYDFSNPDVLPLTEIRRYCDEFDDEDDE